MADPGASAGTSFPPRFAGPLGRRCPACGHFFDSDDARFCPFDGESLVSARGMPANALLGSVVDGRYEIEFVLGAGGMGTVYRARHRALDKQFAIKVLRPDLACEQDLSERFLREARAAAAINHANVVQITDFGRLADGAPYFVMELLEGEPLSRLVRREGALHPSRALRIAEQAAAGLGAAHAKGIIHRDLKPDNLHILANDRVKVLDFGVAKVAGLARITKAGVVFGTPYYMSPEQASGEGVGPRADIYALGAILYEVLTGKVPFEADSYMGVLTKHLYVVPEPPSKANPAAGELPALEHIVLRCLAKDPANRYESMEDLGRYLERALDGGCVESSPVAAAQACPRPVEGSADDDGASHQAKTKGLPLGRRARRAAHRPSRGMRWGLLMVSAVAAGVSVGVLVALGLGREGDVNPHAPHASDLAAAGTAEVSPGSDVPPSPSALPVALPARETPERFGETVEGVRPSRVVTGVRTDRQPGASRSPDPSARPSRPRPSTSPARSRLPEGEIIDPWGNR